MSNLIASNQIRGGDLLRVSYDFGSEQLDFVREAEQLPVYEMVSMLELTQSGPADPMTAVAPGAAPPTVTFRPAPGRL